MVRTIPSLPGSPGRPRVKGHSLTGNRREGHELAILEAEANPVAGGGISGAWLLQLYCCVDVGSTAVGLVGGRWQRNIPAPPVCESSAKPRGARAPLALLFRGQFALDPSGGVIRNATRIRWTRTSPAAPPGVGGLWSLLSTNVGTYVFCVL